MILEELEELEETNKEKEELVMNTFSHRCPPGPSHTTPDDFNDALHFFLQVTRKYGDIVQIPTVYGPMYLVNHPEHVRDILHGSTYSRTSILKMGLGEGLLTSEGLYWRSQRRLMQPAFHQECLASWDTLITDATREMMQTLQTSARSDQPIDVPTEMRRLTLRIIGKALLGVDFASKADMLGAAITTYLECMKQIWVFSASQTISPSRNRLYQEALTVIDDVVYGVIEDRRRKSERGNDLLALLLEAEGDGKHSLDERQVRDEVVTMFVAGHETTGNMLAWTWYLLSDHPGVEDRLRGELRDVLGERIATSQDLPKLPFTRMVIQESMRLYPPVWILYRKSLVDNDVGGYHIPANAIVLLSPYTTHRHPDYWEDPDRFDPERFSPGRQAGHPHYAYFPFGGGSHVCIGQHLAMAEGSLILATVSQQYRLRLVPGQRLEPDPFITLRHRYGLRMMLEPTEPMAMNA